MYLETQRVEFIQKLNYSEVIGKEEVLNHTVTAYLWYHVRDSLKPASLSLDCKVSAGVHRLNSVLSKGKDVSGIKLLIMK
jgi:hypothetical protein